MFTVSWRRHEQTSTRSRRVAAAHCALVITLAVAGGVPLPAETDVDEVPTRKTLYAFIENRPASYPIERSESEWGELLTEREYRILRRDATEAEWTGDLIDVYEAGTYYSRYGAAPIQLST